MKTADDATLLQTNGGAFPVLVVLGAGPTKKAIAWGLAKFLVKKGLECSAKSAPVWLPMAGLEIGEQITADQLDGSLTQRDKARERLHREENTYYSEENGAG